MLIIRPEIPQQANDPRGQTTACIERVLHVELALRGPGTSCIEGC
jgi:hypothetical protein